MLKIINDLKRHVAPYRDEISKSILNVVDSGWFVLGPNVQLFEKQFGNYLGGGEFVSLANGTDALKFALLAIGMTHNSRILTVANAGNYSSIAINSIKAVPVYVDVDIETGLIDINEIEKTIKEKKVDALILTHLYGSMVDIEAIVRLANNYGVLVVEDCAQSHGASINGKYAGDFGDLASFSFYPTKNLGAMGDGGGVYTKNASIAAKLRMLRQYGWDKKYHSEIKEGWNSRLDEIQAAILTTLLPYLDIWNLKRRSIIEEYRNAIKNDKLEFLNHSKDDSFVGHLFVIKVCNRDGFIEHLNLNSVPFDIHYPIPDYKQISSKCKITLPNTEQLCSQVLTLPCFPEMTKEEILWVSNIINKW